MFAQRTQIPLCEWWRRATTSCRTISGRYWPVCDPRAYEYYCTVGCFISHPTYLPRFVSQDGGSMVGANEQGAKSITVQDFVKNAAFVKQLIDGWSHPGPIHSAQLLVQICSTCQRRVVIDGVHRLVYMASQGTMSGDLYVTELEGREWPRNMPDMSAICAC